MQQDKAGLGVQLMKWLTDTISPVRRWLQNLLGRSKAPEPYLPINYVPNEICVGVTTKGDVPVWPLYETVRVALNQVIERVLTTDAPATDDPFERDRGYEVLRQLRSSRGIVRLLDLQRPGMSLEDLKREDPIDLDQDTERRPWVRLPEISDQVKTLFFYAIEPNVKITPYSPEEVKKAKAIVREMSFLLIRHTLGWAWYSSGKDKGDASFHVDSVGPNWLCIPSPEHTCGGPGSMPAPIKTTDKLRYQVSSVDSMVGPLLTTVQTEGSEQGGTSPKVVVAVLDTRPEDETLENAPKIDANNTWMSDVVTKLRQPSPTGRDLSFPETPYFDYLSQIGPRVYPNLYNVVPPPLAPIPDHGLFVAGLIQKLAPTADLYLYRVLNKNGVGDLFALACVLCQLPDEFLGDPNCRLVVNMSLMVDVPPGDRLLSSWFNLTSQNCEALVAHVGQISWLLNLLSKSLRDVIHDVKLAHGDRILMVGAAGNDRRPGVNTPQEPRAPAYYPEVWGVSAVARGLQPSPYSNQGDLATENNGIAVFGGNADATRTYANLGQTINNNASGYVDAVMGLYSAPCYYDGPPDSTGAAQKNTKNDTGLAYWSGTSFATAFVSGLAAKAWTKPTNQVGLPLTGDQAMVEEIIGTGRTADPDLLVPILNIQQN